MLVGAAIKHGRLVDLALCFSTYGSKPKKVWRRVKKWVAQRRSKPELWILNVTMLVCFSVSVCSAYTVNLD